MTYPRGSAWRSRSPVEEPTYSVTTSWFAKPYNRRSSAVARLRDSPSDGANFSNTPTVVSSGSRSQSAPVVPSTSGLASSAGPAARAVAIAADTISRNESSVTDERPTTPAAVPSPAPTVAITVTLEPRIAPFVVSVLFAQRRLVLDVSATSTTQPSAPSAAARARPRSIVSCGVS